MVNAGKLLPAGRLSCLAPLRLPAPHPERAGGLTGLDATVVGRSNIVGKPMAHLLLAEDCTVTVAHSKTRDLRAAVHNADILVAAVGRPEMIPGEWISPVPS